MLVYRICRARFATSLQASGCAGRWNSDSQWVLYASANRSLAALEQVANRSNIMLHEPYSILIIDVPDSELCCTTIQPELLPSDWKHLSGYGALQEIGSRWYRTSETLLLRVPSVIIPQESNYLINTRHPDFHKQVKLIDIEPFGWDHQIV